jgi:hypothetical protein
VQFHLEGSSLRLKARQLPVAILGELGHQRRLLFPGELGLLQDQVPILLELEEQVLLLLAEVFLSADGWTQAKISACESLGRNGPRTSTTASATTS